ncbi:MAG: NPCBM/NEW2 domain-containing protein [Armatimonadetes bacterium]|nr:NPCBM/NEW2 domain-containing protein [Armatimonadota bacterium]
MQINLACLLLATAAGAAPIVLKGAGGVEAVFGEQDGKLRLTAYRDPAAHREWPIAGPLFSLQTTDGNRVNLGDGGFTVPADAPPIAAGVTLEAAVAPFGVTIRQVFGFCADGRTLRIKSSLRAADDPVTIQRVGLLELKLAGQTLQRIGPPNVSCPIVGDRLYAGVEHPSVICQVDGDTMYLAQHSYTRVGAEWVSVPPAILGAASDADMAGPEGVRRAFLRYLDTVRVQPRDLHVHYNNWWTMPVPFTEQDVLDNIAALKKGLYDPTGFFFDSYAMDMGWSDPHTVWEVDRKGWPHGFANIRDALAKVHSQPGLWVSPSSLYPPAGKFACLAVGGRYQTAFKAAVLKHARDGNFAHVKFDGLAWPCTANTHGHRPEFESFQPIAEGLADVFDALRAEHPDIALEPTCLGYYPSPWWLMHTPFVIGPFGDDCPRGVSPCPEWLDALTTGRDVANLRGRDAFWMPTSALECFDIVVQCPSDMRNHAVMAIARGHWFQSTYINPRYMDEGEWRFFAALMRWAREHKGELQDPVVFGGDPAKRQAYGYAYLGAEHACYFVRNPWMEETAVRLPGPLPLLAKEGAGGGPATPMTGHGAQGGVSHEIRLLYPVREVLCRLPSGSPPPSVTLGPYELMVLEAVPTTQPPRAPAAPPKPGVTWTAEAPPACERRIYAAEPAAYGPSWSSPEGDAEQALVVTAAGQVDAAAPAELCLLVETKPGTSPATCGVTLDGQPAAAKENGTRGAFAATGAAAQEDWQWFRLALPKGRHALTWRVNLPDENARCGAYVRGLQPASKSAEKPQGLAFPLPAAPGHPWSVTLMPVRRTAELGVTERHVERPVVHIDGIYLDTLDWLEATTGWGTVHRNVSVMGTPMAMAGRVFHRGIGTHANSRIVYDLPAGFDSFAATIGCDQEVWANSIVFVVEGDGKKLYRSPLLRRDTEPVDISLPIRGVKRLTLIVEDGGDGNAADHGNWAEARLLHGR